MAKLNMAYLTSLNKRGKTACRPTCRNCCRPNLPVSPSQNVLLVPPALHQTIWCRSTFGPRGPGFEQSHLLPEACSPDGTDKRRQRLRRTKRPPPEPSNILKRFYALYDDKIRYFKKKVSKLYCIFNRNSAGVPIWEHGKKSIP